MLTIAAIEPEIPLLVGRLAVQRKGSIEFRRPFLELSIFCPACRSHHYFEWPENALAVEVVATQPPPCERPNFLGEQIAVGLDPELRPVHRRLLVDFKASLRRWRSEQRAREVLVDERAFDRDYRREWPEVAPRSA